MAIAADAASPGPSSATNVAVHEDLPELPPAAADNVQDAVTEQRLFQRKGCVRASGDNAYVYRVARESVLRHFFPGRIGAFFEDSKVVIVMRFCGGPVAFAVILVFLIKPLRDAVPALHLGCGVGCVVSTIGVCHALGTATNVNIAGELHRTPQFWFLFFNVLGVTSGICVKATFLIDEGHGAYNIAVALHVFLSYLRVLYMDAWVVSPAQKLTKAFWCGNATVMTFIMVCYYILSPRSWNEGGCLKAAELAGDSSLTGSFCLSQLVRVCMVNLLVLTMNMTIAAGTSGNCLILGKPIRFDKVERDVNRARVAASEEVAASLEDAERGEISLTARMIGSSVQQNDGLLS